MPTNIDAVEELVLQLIAEVQMLPQKIIVAGKQIIVNEGLSDISDNLGTILAGEFQVGNRLEPGRGFTGMRMGYPAMTYGSDDWHLVGVNNDTLQFGVRASDGKLLAGGGAVILDENGVTAVGGTIGGWAITSDAIKSPDDTIILESSSSTIAALDGLGGAIALSGSTGLYSDNFLIDLHGNADFRNVRVRGEIVTSVLTYQQLQATAGSLGIFKSAGKLRTQVLGQAPYVLDIDDPASGHAALFEVGDNLCVKVGVNMMWFQVDSITDQTTHYSYACTLLSGTPFTITVGEAVVDYGTVGQGFLLQSADDIHGPFFSVREFAGATVDPTELVRLGNLNGWGDYLTDQHGIALGLSTQGNLTWDATNGLRLRAGTTTKIQMDNLGNAYITGILNIDLAGEIRQGTGALGVDFTGLRIWNETSVGRIAGYAADVPQWYAGTDGKLYAGAGALWLDSDGISLGVEDDLWQTPAGSVKFMHTNTSVLELRSSIYTKGMSDPFDINIGRILSKAKPGNDAHLEIMANSTNDNRASLTIGSAADAGASAKSAQLTFVNDFYTDLHYAAISADRIQLMGKTSINQTTTSYLDLPSVPLGIAEELFPPDGARFQTYQGTAIQSNQYGRRKVLGHSSPLLPFLGLHGLRNLYYGYNVKGSAAYMKDWAGGFDLTQSGYLDGFASPVNGFLPISYTQADGVDYLYNASSVNMKANNWFFVGGWFYIPTYNSVNPLVKMGDTQEEWLLYVNNNNLSFEAYNSAGVAKYATTMSCPAGWHFLGCLFGWNSAASYTYKLYVDDVWGSNSPDPGAALRDPTGNFTLFKHGATLGRTGTRASLVLLTGFSGYDPETLAALYEDTRPFYGI